jgi:hypothetical protein
VTIEEVATRNCLPGVGTEGIRTQGAAISRDKGVCVCWSSPALSSQVFPFAVAQGMEVVKVVISVLLPCRASQSLGRGPRGPKKR